MWPCLRARLMDFGPISIQCWWVSGLKIEVDCADSCKSIDQSDLAAVDPMIVWMYADVGLVRRLDYGITILDG